MKTCCQPHASSALPPVERTMVSMGRGLDGPQDRSGRLGKRLVPCPSRNSIPGLSSPFSGHYTDSAVTAPENVAGFIFLAG